MAKSDIPRTLRDLQKKGYTIPGIDMKAGAKLPVMPAMCECPTCGERIPIIVQVRNLTFAVSYPIRKELVTRRPKHA